MRGERSRHEADSAPTGRGNLRVAPKTRVRATHIGRRAPPRGGRAVPYGDRARHAHSSQFHFIAAGRMDQAGESPVSEQHDEALEQAFNG